MEELPELALQRIDEASLQGNRINRLEISESVRAGSPRSEVYTAFPTSYYPAHPLNGIGFGQRKASSLEE